MTSALSSPSRSISTVRLPARFSRVIIRQPSNSAIAFTAASLRNHRAAPNVASEGPGLADIRPHRRWLPYLAQRLAPPFTPPTLTRPSCPSIRGIPSPLEWGFDAEAQFRIG